MDSNNDVMKDLEPVFMIYTLPYATVGLTDRLLLVILVLKVLTYLTTILCDILPLVRPSKVFGVFARNSVVYACNF